MKKTLFALAALLTAVVACTPDNPQEEAIVATYYLTTNQTEILTLAENRGRDVNINVRTRESVGGEANLTFTYAADLTLVDAYNAKNGTNCLAMPSEAYEIANPEVTVARFNTQSTTGKVTLKAKGIEAGETYVLPVSITSVTGGEYKLDESAKTVYLLLQLFSEDEGGEDEGGEDEGDEPGAPSTSNLDYTWMQGLYDDPCVHAPATKTPDYTINTVEDMKNLRNILVEGQTKYVVLGADIDMASITDWTPLNSEGTFGKAIEFNGQGHKIKNFKCAAGSYRSFFGILNGRIYNVTFENPVIDAKAGLASNDSSQPCGVVAGYGGNKSGMIAAYVYDVKITGADISAIKAGGCGGVIGVAVNTIVKRCSFDGTIVDEGTGRRCGGIVGYHNVQANDAFLRIEDCISSGSLTAAQNIGGIIGQTQYSGSNAGGYKAKVSVVANCISTMSLAGRNCGGIVGGASYGGSFAEAIAGDIDSCRDMIVKNIAWNDKIDATGTTTGAYSSGAIVGYCNVYQYFYDCYRKSSLDFICPVMNKDNAEVKEFDIEPIDQPNSGGDVKTLYDGTMNDESCGYAYQYAYPYHGKSATGASAAAKTLGWNENVWDLSGSVPVLK